jgi:hypothetical protein
MIKNQSFTDANKEDSDPPSSSTSSIKAMEKAIKSKAELKQNRIGDIKVTRNIRAKRVEKVSEPIHFPESGVLYEFHVENWENKMAFYDNIAYSFGVPSTQKIVFCSYLNCPVMHYERTCQGVYYCPHINSIDGSNTANNVCTVKPCRYRFQHCELHKVSLKKCEERCRLKLHFYIPKDPKNYTRLLLCIGDHNHPEIHEYQPDTTDVLSSSPKSSIVARDIVFEPKEEEQQEATKKKEEQSIIPQISIDTQPAQRLESITTSRSIANNEITGNDHFGNNQVKDTRSYISTQYQMPEGKNIITQRNLHHSHQRHIWEHAQQQYNLNKSSGLVPSFQQQYSRYQDFVTPSRTLPSSCPAVCPSPTFVNNRNKFLQQMQPQEISSEMYQDPPSYEDSMEFALVNRANIYPNSITLPNPRKRLYSETEANGSHDFIPTKRSDISVECMNSNILPSIASFLGQIQYQQLVSQPSVMYSRHVPSNQNSSMQQELPLKSTSAPFSNQVPYRPTEQPGGIQRPFNTYY